GKSMNAPLEGQVALVTGASRGIGRAIAIALASSGAKVLVNYLRQEDAARETVALVEAAGGRAEDLRFDVADAEATTRAIADAVGKSGRLDILVNNAGAIADNLVMRLKDEDWERALAVNLNGTFHCTRAALRPMVRARRGRIVNVASVIGLM